MKILKAKKHNLKKIAELRKDTIEKINSKYLPKSDIQVLIAMNSYKNLLRRIKKADMFYIKDNNNILGTIDLKNNEIKGLYVNYKNQNQGHGSFLLDFIEKYAKKRKIKKINLDCNVSAYEFYLKKEYRLKKKKLPSGKKIKRMIYVMEKRL